MMFLEGRALRRHSSQRAGVLRLVEDILMRFCLPCKWLGGPSWGRVFLVQNFCKSSVFERCVFVCAPKMWQSGGAMTY
jgi:hypothetical protein